MRGVQDVVGVMTRELVGEMSLNQIRVLVEVMHGATAGQRVEMRDVGASLKLGRGTVSRLVATLTAEGYTGRPGLDLIIRVEDANDRRMKMLVLTERGRELCVTLGATVHRLALVHRERIVELVAAKSEGTVRAGVDPTFGVCVYLVSGPYLTATYRQIVTKMNERPDYRLAYNEIIDLTEARSFEVDDAGVRVGMAVAKSFHGLSRWKVFITDDPAALRRLEDIEAQYRKEDLNTFSVVNSLADAKVLLQLPSSWQYPDTSLLCV